MKWLAAILICCLTIACPISTSATGPAGHIRAVRGPDCTAFLRDVRTGEVIAPLYEHPLPCANLQQRCCGIAVGYSGDGKLLATQRRPIGEPIMLWDLRTGLRLSELRAHGEAVSLRFSRDSSLLLALDGGGGKLNVPKSITVWKVEGAEELLHVRAGAQEKFTEAQLAPDGKTLMAYVTRVKCLPTRVITTNEIRLWDMASCQQLMTVKGQSAEFSPDGGSVIVVDSGRSSRLKIEPPESSALAKRAKKLQAFVTENVAARVGEKKWKWTVFIKPGARKIDEVECVSYELHPAFPDPVRLVCDQGDPKRPFGLTATGWGTFRIEIRVFMKDGSYEDLRHFLKF